MTGPQHDLIYQTGPTVHPFARYYTEAMIEAALRPPAGFNPFRSDGPSGPKSLHWLVGLLNPGFRAVLDAAAVEHDFAYWRGGTEEERLAADQQFRRRLEGWPRLAEKHYQAVRLGGAAGTGLPWQWGYGRKA